jgi:hypothetical protein
MAKKILSAGYGTVTYMHDEQDGKVAIETVSDVTQVLERAKALHNEGRTRTHMGDRHVASIDVTVLDAWARRIGKRFGDVMRDDKLMDRFLQDPAHSYFVIDKASV